MTGPPLGLRDMLERLRQQGQPAPVRPDGSAVSKTPRPTMGLLDLVMQGIEHVDQRTKDQIPANALLGIMPDVTPRSTAVSVLKKMGLPATGKTPDLVRLAEIAQKTPQAWSREEFQSVMPHLLAHQDLRPGSAERVGSILSDGLKSGMADDLATLSGHRKGWSWGGSFQGGDSYLFFPGQFPRDAGARLVGPAKPLAHIPTTPQMGLDDVYTALTRKK